jgi:hypothetical protein
VTRRLHEDLHAAVDGYRPKGDPLATIVERGVRARRRDRLVRRSAVALALCAVVAVAVPIAMSRPDVGPAVNIEPAAPTPAAADPTPSPSPTIEASVGLADLLGTGGPWIRVGLLSDADVTDVALLGDRLLIAGTVDDARGRRATVWSSPNGRDWGLQALSQQESSIQQIVSGPDGALAVGDVAGTPQAWWTPDGTDWTPAPPPPGLMGPPVVTRAAGQWIAFGTTLSSSSTIESRIYTSTDARIWTERPVPSVRNAFGLGLQVAEANDLVVVVNREDILRSTDGGSNWEAVPEAEALPINAARITAMPDGAFLAVGTIGTQPDDSFIPSLPSVAFTSPDGVTWTRTGDVGTGIAVLDLVSRPDGTAVAVGGSPDQDGRLRADAWISYDGGATWSSATELLEGPRGGELIGVTVVDGEVALTTGPDGDAAAVWAGVP